MISDERIDQHLEARRREREVRRAGAEHRALAAATLADVMAECTAGERIAASQPPRPQTGALAARMAQMVGAGGEPAATPTAGPSAPDARALARGVGRGALATHMRRMVERGEIR